MTDWYYLKYRKPVPYGCNILTDPSGYTKLYRKHKRQRKVRSKFVKGLHISTVFLGLNHCYNDGEPLLFETMIFGGDNEYQTRCSTHRQALKQHQRAIKWVKND